VSTKLGSIHISGFVRIPDQGAWAGGTFIW